MKENKVERLIQQERSKKTRDAEMLVKNLLNDIKLEDSTKIPKGVYEEYFEPYLTGKLPVTEDNTIIVKWVELAKGPKRSVDIIDDEGNIIFKVPPIIDPNGINMEESNKINYGAIGAEYEIKHKRSPITGNEYLGAMLTGVGERVIKENDTKLEELPVTDRVINSTPSDFLEYD